MAQTYRNRAFISYSQTDKLLASRLQKWLEAFRAPKELGGRRIGRIFRDETDLSGAADLGEALKAEIDGSRALIVLCSPRSARSDWVAREIRHFRDTGRGSQVFALILEGVPNSADTATECFPSVFRDGANAGVEPLAVNLAADGRERAFTRLASGLLGVPFDALWQRERRRQRALAAWAASAIGAGLALTALAIVGNWVALETTLSVLQRNSDLIARESRIVSEAGDQPTALLLSLHADPAASSGWMQRVLVSDGYDIARARLVAAHEQMRLLRVIPQESDTFLGSAWSSDDRYIAIGASDVRIYDARSGMLKAQLDPGGDANFRPVVFDREGGVLGAAASANGTIGLWSRSSKSALRVFSGGAGGVRSIAISDENTKVAAGLEGGEIIVFDYLSGSIDQTLRGHSGGVNSLQFSSDGTRLLSASDDSTANIWDIASGQVVTSHRSHTAGLWSARFIGRSGRVASASEDGSVRIWNSQTGGDEQTLDGNSGWVYGAEAAPDGRILISVSEDGRVRAWHVASGALLGLLGSHRDAVLTGRLSNDGKRVLTTSSDGEARLWSADFDELTPAGHGVFSYSSAAIMPDGNRFLAGSDDGSIGIYSLLSGQVSGFEWSTSSPVHSVAVSPDGRRAVAGAKDGTINVWGADDGKSLLSIEPNSTDAAHLRISPDGKLLAASFSSFKLAVFSLETGELLQSLQLAGREYSYGWSSASDGAATLEVAHSGDPMPRFESPQVNFRFHPVESAVDMAVSPDGEIMAAGQGFGMTARVVIRETGSGAELQSMPGHQSRISSVAFSPDGTTVATADSEGHIRLWDASTGEFMAVKFVLNKSGEMGALSDITFSEDGRKLLALSAGLPVLFQLPEIMFADAPTQVRMACDKLWTANAPLAFVVADIAKYPVLKGQPVDPDDPAKLRSPCKGVLPLEAFASSFG